MRKVTAGAMLTGGILVAFQNCGEFKSVVATGTRSLSSSGDSNGGLVRLTSDDELLVNALATSHDELMVGWVALGVSLPQIEVLNGSTYLQGTATSSQILNTQSAVDTILNQSADKVNSLSSTERSTSLLMVNRAITRLAQIEKSGLSGIGSTLMLSNSEIFARLRTGLQATPAPGATATPTPTPGATATPTPAPTATPASNQDAAFTATLQAMAVTMRPQMKNFGLTDADAGVLCGDTLKNGTITSASVSTAQTNANNGIATRKALIAFSLTPAKITAAIADIDSGLAELNSYSPSSLSAVAAQLRAADIDVLGNARAALKAAQ